MHFLLSQLRVAWLPALEDREVVPLPFAHVADDVFGFVGVRVDSQYLTVELSYHPILQFRFQFHWKWSMSILVVDLAGPR